MSWIFSHIKQLGLEVAITFKNRQYTYTELHEKIEDFYRQISSSIPNGCVVSIISDYSFESIALLFALQKNKNIIVPITTKVDKEIIDRLLVSGCNYSIEFANNDLCVKQLSVAEKSHNLIVQLQKEGHSGLILFSSGSTGAPKAMIHNFDNLVNSFEGKRGKKIVFLIFLMFDHIGGLNTMLNCIAMGTQMVFPEDRSADNVCQLVEKYKVNVLPASPTFLNLILITEAYSKYDLSSLRMITYGTEPMPDSLLIKLKNIFPRVKFLQTFGTSETGISQTSSKSSSSTFIKLDDPDIEYKIVEDELWLRSKTQILGYLNFSMERFTEDGWFKTGDLVERSEDGEYIKIIGRGKELINVGGEKVLPSEIESILFTMPNLLDCIVYGEFNPIMGQMVVAKVLFAKPIKTMEAKQAITEYCTGKMDKYKIPVKIILMTESEFSDRFKKKRI